MVQGFRASESFSSRASRFPIIMRRVAVLLCMVGVALLIPSDETFAPEGRQVTGWSLPSCERRLRGEVAMISPALLESFPPVLWPLPDCPMGKLIVCRIGVALVTAVVGYIVGVTFVQVFGCIVPRMCFCEGDNSVLQGALVGARSCWTLVVCAAVLVVPLAVYKKPQQISFLDLGQLQNCVSMMAPPRHLLPVHAGADLVEEEMKHRQRYFVCLLLWLVFLAFVAGNVLTWVRKTFTWGIGYCSLPAGPAYSRLAVEDSEVVPELSNGELLNKGYPIAGTTHVPLFLHLALHFFCASLSLFAAATSRLDAKSGVCWEIYVYWMVVMLGCSFLHATYCAWQTPGDLLPNLALPIVKPVLPLVGEPLDTFKDWLFVGIALSQRTWMSAAIAATAVAILVFSGAYLRTHYREELVELYLPVQYACDSQQQHVQGAPKTISQKVNEFCWKLTRSQTSLATLSIALTEDLPQAVFQSVFVLLYGGSFTQFVFIGLSVMKILICVAFRAVVLQSEGRFAESFEAEVLFYRSVVLLLGCILKENNHIALHAKLYLAVATSGCNNGDLEDAERQVQDLVARFESSCGEKHECTLDARIVLVQIMSKRGRFREAEEVQRDVVNMTADLKITNVRRLMISLMSKIVLAQILFHLDKTDEARDLFEKALETCSTCSSTCKCRNCPKQQIISVFKMDAELGLALILRKLGESSKVIQIQKELMELCNAQLGEMHPITLNIQRELAMSFFYAGDFSEAQKLQQQVIELSRRSLGRKSGIALSAQQGLAEILSGLGQTDEARKLLQEVFELRKEVLDAEHPDILETQQALAKLQHCAPDNLSNLDGIETNQNVRSRS